MAVAARLHFLQRPAKSRGRGRCHLPALKVAGEPHPNHLPPRSPRGRLRLLHRRLHPASPAEVERFWAECSRTTNSASQSIHRQFRSAPMAGEALRTCPLRLSKRRVHCRRQFLRPASREVAAPWQPRVPRAHLLCPNVQSKEAEAQSRRRESIRAVRRRAILAMPKMVAVRPPTDSPSRDFQERATFPPTMAAAQLRSALPDLAECGHSQLPTRPRVAPQFRLAAIPPIPWCVRSRPAGAPQRSSDRSTENYCARWPTAERMAWTDQPPGWAHVDLLPA
jgi:hypothetical protein